MGQLAFRGSCPLAIAVAVPDLVTVSASIDGDNAPSAMALDRCRLLRGDDAMGEGQSALVGVDWLQPSSVLAVVFGALGWKDLVTARD